ncbi:MAG: hypothetical protein J6B10_00600 [Lachnospiraceae bacterium]|nr:hypothetical protein [Lachnospiraceae bacterium]
MKRKTTLCTLLLMLTLSMTGCGKDEQLETYKEDMTAFYEVIQEKSDAIDMIDTTSETAVDELLGYLDDINTEFTALGEMKVPKQFASIESLADDAASYMNEANRLYHEAYANGSYDDSVGEAARQNYERAMKRISYIADIFHGEIPDDANVTVITEGEDDAPAETEPDT